MKRIKQLPDNLINQIAAGEAIERPASIVKELCENSIDAGATKIEIEISNATRDIRIADNGSGIHKDDVMLAFSRHATSKIEKQNDLWNLYTLGFRGEALSSIISVAKVTCTTKTAEAEAGLKVKCENSKIDFSETGCAVGTTMEVRELFYNVPARLKFLKKPHTEMAAISEIVQNLAISNPAVAFALIHNKNQILKTTGGGELSGAISEVYSKELMGQMREVSKEDEQFGLKISGFASNPDFVRSNKKAIYTFINGRTVKCPIISKAIDTAYSDLIPSGRYPYAVLNISVPPKDIDVNVHPTKKEVKYTNPNLIFNFVYSGVKAALDIKERIEAGYAVPPDVDYAAHCPIERDFSTRLPAAVSVEMTEEYDIQEVSYREPLQKTFEVESDGYDMFVEKPKIVGQLENTYIIVQINDGMQIIDQHIAHERYLYEKFKLENRPSSQMLLATKELAPEPEQLAILKENTEVLFKHGYEFEFTESGVFLKRIPNTIAEKDPEKIFRDLIEALESAPDTIENELLIRTACLSAVKAGEKLSVWQMEELVMNWQKTSYPRTCPHGRKIAHVVSSREIAGYFSRQV